MLARLSRELPIGGVRYEPKWDGFRCLIFRDGDRVDLRSRHDRPLGRYFPELVAGVRAMPRSGVVLDGEILLAPGDGRVHDFAALMARLHPAATRVERLAREHPAIYVAFDLLAEDDTDLRRAPFAERRRRLESVLERSWHPILLTPSTVDLTIARTWLDDRRGGVDGVVAKPVDGPYEPGRRAMIKVKRERTAECVVAGIRLSGSRAEPLVSSLILGLYDEASVLRHVGVVTQFAMPDRRAILRSLEPFAIPLDAHPWRDGFIVGASPLGRLKGSAGRWTPDMDLDWVPLRPETVVEVAFDQVDVDRFRHPARFRRWRPDRDPLSCRIDQIRVEPAPLPAFVDSE